MSTPSGTGPASGDRQDSRANIVAELEDRIAKIEALEDSEIGSFTGRDWVICVVGAVVVPALAIWWFAP